MKISLGAQIEEVQYELDMRRDVYARQVAQHKMRESVASLHVERMEAVLDTLRWLQKNEAAVRASVARSETAALSETVDASKT